MLVAIAPKDSCYEIGRSYQKKRKVATFDFDDYLLESRVPKGKPRFLNYPKQIMANSQSQQNLILPIIPPKQQNPFFKSPPRTPIKPIKEHKPQLNMLYLLFDETKEYSNDHNLPMNETENDFNVFCNHLDDNKEEIIEKIQEALYLDNVYKFIMKQAIDNNTREAEKQMEINYLKEERMTRHNYHKKKKNDALSPQISMKYITFNEIIEGIIMHCIEVKNQFNQVISVEKIGNYYDEEVKKIRERYDPTKKKAKSQLYQTSIEHIDEYNILASVDQDKTLITHMRTSSMNNSIRNISMKDQSNYHNFENGNGNHLNIQLASDKDNKMKEEAQRIKQFVLHRNNFKKVLRNMKGQVISYSGRMGKELSNEMQEAYQLKSRFDKVLMRGQNRNEGDVGFKILDWKRFFQETAMIEKQKYKLNHYPNKKHQYDNDNDNDNFTEENQIGFEYIDNNGRRRHDRKKSLSNVDSDQIDMSSDSDSDDSEMEEEEDNNKCIKSKRNHLKRDSRQGRTNGKPSNAISQRDGGVMKKIKVYSRNTGVQLVNLGDKYDIIQHNLRLNSARGIRGSYKKDLLVMDRNIQRKSLNSSHSKRRVHKNRRKIRIGNQGRITFKILSYPSKRIMRIKKRKSIMQTISDSVNTILKLMQKQQSSTADQIHKNKEINKEIDNDPKNKLYNTHAVMNKDIKNTIGKRELKAEGIISQAKNDDNQTNKEKTPREALNTSKVISKPANPPVKQQQPIIDNKASKNNNATVSIKKSTKKTTKKNIIQKRQQVNPDAKSEELKKKNDLTVSSKQTISQRPLSNKDDKPSDSYVANYKKDNIKGNEKQAVTPNLSKSDAKNKSGKDSPDKNKGASSMKKRLRNLILDYSLTHDNCNDRVFLSKMESKENQIQKSNTPSHQHPKVELYKSLCLLQKDTEDANNEEEQAQQEQDYYEEEDAFSESKNNQNSFDPTDPNEGSQEAQSIENSNTKEADYSQNLYPNTSYQSTNTNANNKFRKQRAAKYKPRKKASNLFNVNKGKDEFTLIKKNKNLKEEGDKEQSEEPISVKILGMFRKIYALQPDEYEKKMNEFFDLQMSQVDNSVKKQLEYRLNGFKDNMKKDIHRKKEYQNNVGSRVRFQNLAVVSIIYICNYILVQCKRSMIIVLEVLKVYSYFLLFFNNIIYKARLISYKKL